MPEILVLRRARHLTIIGNLYNVQKIENRAIKIKNRNRAKCHNFKPFCEENFENSNM